MKKYLLARFVVLLSGTLPVWAQAQGTVSFAMQNYAVAENAGIAIITVNLVRSNGSEGVLAVQCYTVLAYRWQAVRRMNRELLEAMRAKGIQALDGWYPNPA